MSKKPLLDMGNIRIEKLVIVADTHEDVIPYGLGLPVYGTDPDPETNDPGTILFNSTTNTANLTRNDGTYVPLAFGGDVPSGNIVLESYASDGSAPSVSGSIYLNTTDFPNTVRYFAGGKFNNMLAAHGGVIDTFSTQFVNLPAAAGAGQAVEYNQFVAAPFLPSTSTLNAIATAHPTTANISMNTHKLTGLVAGTFAGEAVEFSQLAGFYPSTTPLQSITLATADVNVNTHKLLNVVDPASAQDGATKNYVDTTTLASTSTLNSIATANATTADISMSSHKITSLAAGSVAGDAVEYSQLVTAAGTHASYSMWLTTPASTTITVAGTMYKLAGTFAYGTGANFGNSSTDNRFVYTGTTTAMMQMAVSATLSHDAVATATNIRVAIMKNGVTLLGAASSTLQAGSTVLDNIPISISTVGQTSMATNDYLEIFVTTDAIVGTTSVTPVAVLATINAVS